MSTRLTRTKMPYTWLFLLMMPCVGCGYGPEETVTVKIAGSADQAQRDEILEKLKDLTDGSSHSISSTWSGDTMTVELAPVSNIDAFSKRIAFGKVTNVDG